MQLVMCAFLVRSLAHKMYFFHLVLVNNVNNLRLIYTGRKTCCITKWTHKERASFLMFTSSSSIDSSAVQLFERSCLNPTFDTTEAQSPQHRHRRLCNVTDWTRLCKNRLIWIWVIGKNPMFSSNYYQWPQDKLVHSCKLVSSPCVASLWSKRSNLFLVYKTHFTSEVIITISQRRPTRGGFGSILSIEMEVKERVELSAGRIDYTCSVIATSVRFRLHKKC